MTRNANRRIPIIGVTLLTFSSGVFAAQTSAEEDASFSSGRQSEPAPQASAPHASSFPQRMQFPRLTQALDLRAPDVTKLFPPALIQQILAQTHDRNIEEVEVEGSRQLPPTTPSVWPGIAAPFWAIVNPTQAWRIFLPLPPDQMTSVSQPPLLATTMYFSPAAAPPRMAGEVTRYNR